MRLTVALRFATLLLLLLSTVIDVCGASEFCDSKFKSTDPSDSDQARILHGLSGISFSAESHINGSKTEYAVRVCGNVSKAEPGAAALQNGTTVLGRVNNTSIVKGGDWMMMLFGSGDPYPDKYNCSGPRYAFVMIHCNHNISVENSMRFIKEAREEKNSCFYMFEVHSHLACAQTEKIGGGTVFTIIVLFVVLTYAIGGILYKRLVLGAKGLEQIPNLTFWRSAGSRIMDVCNRFCGKKTSADGNSWENLGPRVERDDDSLLPP